MITPRPSRFVEAGGRRGLHVSFEFFPPKSAEMEQSLWESVRRLAPLKPDFVSVTYGAGGSTRERTHATVERILAETMLTPAAHLTCVGATRDEIDEVVARLWEAGVRHIVALRGDPRGGFGGLYAASRRLPERRRTGRRHQARRRRYRMSVSAYPEKHPDSPTVERRHRHAQGQGRRRRDAGHDPVLLRERPLFPLSRPRPRGAASISRSCRASCRCRTSSRPKISPSAPAPSVPAWLADRFDGLDDDPATRKLIAAAVAAEQVIDLVDHGVTRLSFLHHEPRRSCLRRLPSARIMRPKQGAGRRGSLRETSQGSVREPMNKPRAEIAGRRLRCARFAASASSCSTAPWAP